MDHTISNMRTYKEFKQAYKKFLLEPSEFISSEMVSCSDDIPTDDISYKNAVIRAYIFLSNCKSRDISHLKILTSYEKLMRKNREAGMNTNAVDFAMILYVFHQYCVRILRSPWRTDFFTIKIYNGFYEYTLRKVLAPSVIDDMMMLIGFRRDPVDNVFLFTLQNFDHSCVRTITDAGIGCFLSYTHCMAKNDLHFKKTVPGLTHLLQNPATNESQSSLATAMQRSRSPEEPGTSGLSGQQHRAQNDPYSMSAPRERRREKRNLYGSDQPSHSRTIKPDLYGSAGTPVDLSMGNGVPYGHRAKKISEDRQSNSSHGSESVDLYGGGTGESKSANEDYAAHERALTPETLPSENSRKLSPSKHARSILDSQMASSKRVQSILDSQMEKFSVSEKQERLSSGYSSMLEHVQKPSLDHVSKYSPRSYTVERSKDYVTFINPHSSTARGSPDGEMATETFDRGAIRTSRDHKRSTNVNDHVYEDVK